MTSPGRVSSVRSYAEEKASVEWEFKNVRRLMIIFYCEISASIKLIVE